MSAPTPAQRLAADPARHVIVAASAGTGKTRVLVDRMVRILVAGTPPARLLALTFTRAAAAEMQNRLLGRLAGWLTADDAALAADLEALGCDPSPATVAHARTLFAAALDVPGGLRIQTIHSFAQGLLASFPVEANLEPGFRAIDPREATSLARRARDEVLAEAIAAGDSAFLDRLGRLSVRLAESGFDTLVEAAVAHAAQLHDAEALERDLRDWLQLAPEADRAASEQAALADPALHALVTAYRDAMRRIGGQRATGYADCADAVLARLPDPAILPALADLVFTADDKPRSFAAADRAQPGTAAVCARLADAVEAIRDIGRAHLLAAHAADALHAACRIARRYAALKSALLAIDYQDMISRTVALLGQPSMPHYVLWKLDQRIDHVLVDEAQDSNAQQWSIVTRLIEDFFDTASDPPRRLFVVGDQKQAIYGFQGAEPRAFLEVAETLKPRAEAACAPIAAIGLDLSFRSGPAVLALVNALIGAHDPQRMGLPDRPPPHEPHRAEAGGEVVLWPYINAGADAQADDDNAEAAERLMADRLAGQIAAWLDPDSPERLWLPAHRRHAQAGDILIALRRRSSLMGELVRRLHAANVPVAGVDRLLLTEPLAVLDCLALLRFAINPTDDLTLACLLVSPFLGWSHEEVRAIAQPRAHDLWAALGAAAASDRKAHDARAWLNAVLALADRGGAHRFLDTILSGPLEGRRRLLARLGSEAEDPIDELLLQALAHDMRDATGLAGFLAALERDHSPLTREPGEAKGQVRLMTIHGAKGLEAPVVVLPDACTKPEGNRRGWLPLDLPSGRVPLFHLSASESPAAARALCAAHDASSAQESFRLLYVAITRAADHLFIGGATGSRTAAGLGTADDRRWWSILDRLFADGHVPGAVRTTFRRWGGDGWRLTAGRWPDPADAPPSRIGPDAAAHRTGPAVRTGPAEPPGPSARPLVPSALADAPAAPATAAGAARARQRGILVHRLLQHLPALEPAARPAAAAAFLARQALDPAEASALAADTLALFDNPALAGLLDAPDALVEAPVAGVVAGRALAGTVDRLIVGPDRATLIDFKTAALVPADAASVPLAIQRQMAAYRAIAAAALARPVHALLLYTAAPRLIALDGATLDRVAAELA